MTTPSEPPATPPVPPERGWYPDPWRQKRERFWDGARWTGQVKEHSMRFIANALMGGAVLLAGLFFVLYMLVGLSNGMDAPPPQPATDILGVVFMVAWGPFWVGVLMHICRR